MKSPEKDLLDKIQKGDDKAFASLFRDTYAKLCTFAHDFIQKTEIAEDIVQEVFIKFWDSRKSIQISTSLRAYLYKMVQNNSLNYIRNQNTQKNIKEESIEKLAQNHSIPEMEIADNAFENMISREIENELKIALENLPEQCREIFILCRYEGHSYSEIADILNISVSTVKTQMSRAMERLHLVMKKYL